MIFLQQTKFVLFLQLQKNGMSHGVMVALQILVLPVQVRALVGQQFNH